MSDDSQPTASVILPTYNRSEVIGRAIESVLGQSFDDFELIVVDDCSSDRTEEIVQSYEDPRLEYISHELNRGGSAARNTGINNSVGEYIFFIDSDDTWHPTKLSRQIKYIETQPEGTVAVYCLVERTEGFKKHARSKLRSLLPIGPAITEGKEGDKEIIRDILRMRFQLGGASTLGVKSDVVRQIEGFDESFERHQDWEFLIRVLKRGKISCVDERLVEKYDSGSPSAEVYDRAKTRFLEKFREEIERQNLDMAKVVTIHRYNLSKRYLREGQYKKAFKRAPFTKMGLFKYLSFIYAGFEATVATTHE